MPHQTAIVAITTSLYVALRPVLANVEYYTVVATAAFRVLRAVAGIRLRLGLWGLVSGACPIPVLLCATHETLPMIQHPQQLVAVHSSPHATAGMSAPLQ